MYLAPEVLKSGLYNQKADVYSWAMVFYEILTLTKPYPSMTSADAHRELVGHRGARPPLQYSSIPMPVQCLLRDAWDGDITSRLTMKQVCQRLKELPAALERCSYSTEDASMAQQPRQGSAWCGGGFLDTLFGFVAEIQCTIIPDTRLEWQDDSSNSLLHPDAPVSNKPTLAVQDLYGSETDETMDSGSFSAASLYLNSISEDELKVASLNETRSPALLEREAETPREKAGAESEERRANGERGASTDMELRCPASPLGRTTSAPQQRRLSHDNGKHGVLDAQWPATVEVPI
jgi:hypothetical protein